MSAGEDDTPDLPDLAELFAAGEHTWPAAKRERVGPWMLRAGQGGGKRVSAATAEAPVTAQDIPQAEAGMRAMGQAPLFMIRAGDDALDAALAARGYEIVDPVTIYSCPVAALTDVEIPPVTAFALWPPLAIMRELWAAGGVGPDRVAVMQRAEQATGIMARWNEKPGGVAFAAVHGDICMVHAVEVPQHQRRQGVAQWMMRRAAYWAQAQGARSLAVYCVEENAAANGLYRRMGFAVAGHYHYRRCKE